MPKLRLQLKVVLLITSLSLLFIYVFTTIQLRNHLDRMHLYNKYRAKVGTIIIKTTLELLTKDVHGNEALASMFKTAIESFSQEEVVEKISIISTDGAVVATNDPVMREFGETKDDMETYFRLSRDSGKDAWFYSTVNDKTRQIDIYIPIYIEAALAYIAKLSFSTVNIQKALWDILLPVSLTAVAVIAGNLFLGFILWRTVVYPIKTLNAATKDIAAGNLDLNVSIHTHDEIQELGETFNDMTRALKKMKEKAEEANPLTKLPGNNTIRQEIEARIRKGVKFVAIHVDLSNFKAYNDRYGIARGDEVIKFTSKILEGAIKTKGSPGDFLGHPGGDDFFMILAPDKANGVVEDIITNFDSKISKFYSEHDAKLGYILERDRKGEFVRFPIMTISLAGVTNMIAPLSSYAELTNIAVEVKHKVKQEKKSMFLIDRRVA